ncbi:MAG: alpha/beta hydrolase [Chitinophagaceae bacterium]
MLNIIKSILSVFIAITFSFAAVAQQKTMPIKFKDFVFKDVMLQKNILYKQDPAPGIKQKYYRFDFYEPAADSTPLRPLIVWMHGGGFKFGNKKSTGTPVWSKTFARRGYVCAAINYRLSKKHPLKNITDLVNGCADAIEDAQEAVAFFKQHYKQFRIDTNYIILAGNSAGGMIALQAVYSSPAEMIKLASSANAVNPANYVYNPQHITAIVSCWGAIFDTTWLQNTMVPIVSVHGSKDRVVPIDHKNPALYGSLAIHRVADSLHIPNQLKIFEGYGHELQKHFNPIFAGGKAKKRWLEAGNFIAGFLYQQLFMVK